MGNFFIKETEEIKNEEAKKLLWKLIQTSENYLYLIWAWWSVESWWKTMKKLWDIVSWNEDEEWNPIIDENWTIEKINNFDALKKEAWYSEWKNLEELLTKIKIAESYFENLWSSKTSEKDKMKSFREGIEINLKNHCNTDIKLCTNSIHENFISKVTNSRKLSHPRTKIFTLNYDTLFESAWNQWGYTIIDWFSFSIPRTFDGTKFDLDIVKRNKNYLEKEDNFEKKVFHLYKLHGSVNRTMTAKIIEDWKIQTTFNIKDTYIFNDNYSDWSTITNPFNVMAKYYQDRWYWTTFSWELNIVEIYNF